MTSRVKDLHYWDSCLLIAAAQPQVEPERARLVRGLWHLAGRGGYNIGISAMTFAEFSKTPEAAALTDEEEAVITQMFEATNIAHFRIVDRSVAKKAREIMRQCALKPADAIHVAAAWLMGAAELCTFDESTLMRKAAGLPLPFPIRFPTWPNGQVPIDPTLM